MSDSLRGKELGHNQIENNGWFIDRPPIIHMNKAEICSRQILIFFVNKKNHYFFFTTDIKYYFIFYLRNKSTFKQIDKSMIMILLSLNILA